MPVQGCIPFHPKAHVTALAGLSLGQEFVDPSTGYFYRLYQIDTACVNDVIANGNALGFQAENVVTNTASRYLISTTYPVAAGVANLGTGNTIPESTSSVTRYMLVLVEGYHAAVLTDGGGDIVANECVVLDGATDGKVDRLLHTTDSADSTVFEVMHGSTIGRATADDSASAVAVKVCVRR